MTKPYQIIDDQWIKLIDGPYAGIMYRYGRVNLIEQHDHLRVEFQYQVDTGEKFDGDFVEYIGRILTELIEDGLANNNIVYTGGIDIDENRAQDLSKSD